MVVERDYVLRKFQSTSPVRGMTSVTEAAMWMRVISIHIPRAGDDRFFVIIIPPVSAISIHIPRAGDDGWSATRATRAADFNPHPPCGG